MDLAVELAHPLTARVDVVRAAQLVNLVAQVRAKPDWPARVARVQRRQAVTLAHNGREVRAELLKVELLLVAQLDRRAVRGRVRQQRVRLLQERLERGLVLVLEQRRKVEHLLREPVQRLRDPALKVAEALVRRRHVLVVRREIWR